jgi:hypothetical protein
MIAVFVMATLEGLLAFSLAGYYISAEKGRGGLEGLVFGFLFGPFGLMLTVLMPEPAVRMKPVVPFKTIITAIGLTMASIVLFALFLTATAGVAKQVTDGQMKTAQSLQLEPSGSQLVFDPQRASGDPMFPYVVAGLVIAVSVLVLVHVLGRKP